LKEKKKKREILVTFINILNHSIQVFDQEELHALNRREND
jgi:hypothetical protein